MNTPEFLNLHIWPVAQRELREGARRPVNHRLRLLSAAVGTLLLWVLVANSDKPADQMGEWLFASLHTLMLGLILAIVPGLTADCISREKREGTLGLLFMTPLRAGGIVAGKALVQALRAFTLWLAVLPMLVTPFTTGGVTWFDTFSALSIEFCAMVLCLAAGLLASSLARERNTAFALAYIFGAGFLVLFIEFSIFVLIDEFQGFAYLVDNYSALWFINKLAMAPFLGTSIFGRSFIGWSIFARTPALTRIWESFCLCSPLATMLIFYAVAKFAAWRVKRSWQDKIPSARRESLLRRYCAPVFKRRFRRRMRRTLDWNPIAWLQQYSWKARASKWGLCLAFLIVVSWDLSKPDSDYSHFIHIVLSFSFAAVYTFAGVSGFLEEKRSGALELLLVTPVSVNKIIFGRVWGLWKQFLPAGLVLLGDYAACVPRYGGFSDVAPGVFVVACLFFTLPVFATYFALRVKNLIVASALTWVALWIPFFFVMSAFESFVSEALRDNISVMLPPMFMSYLAFSLLACAMLRHSLSRRIYSF